MPKKIILIAIPVIFIILALLGLGAKSLLSARQAKIEVRTNPSVEVFLEGEKMGTAPYDEEVSPGEKTISFPGFSQKVPLLAGTTTVVEWDLGPVDVFSGGRVVYYSKDAANLAIISDPPGQVLLDGQPWGETPLVKDVDEGEHTLEIQKEGYLSQTVRARVRKGFTLNIFVTLAASPFPLEEETIDDLKLTILDFSTDNVLINADFKIWAQAASFWKEEGPTFEFLVDEEGKIYDENGEEVTDRTALSGEGLEGRVGYLGKSPELTAPAKDSLDFLRTLIFPDWQPPAPPPQVEILPTPTGFLRVRSGPGTTFSEIGRANPGEKYEYLGEEGDWFKIKFGAQEGWVSKTYARRI